MKIDVNLATRPFINRTPQLSVVGGLLAVTLLATSCNIELVRRSHAATKAAAAQRAEVGDRVRDVRQQRRVVHHALLGIDGKSIDHVLRVIPNPPRVTIGLHTINFRAARDARGVTWSRGRSCRTTAATTRIALVLRVSASTARIALVLSGNRSRLFIARS